MNFSENNRFPVSAQTLFRLCLIVQLVTLPYTANAQWSQTLGWGGAGYGKRSSNMLTNTAPQTPRNTCLPNPVILHIAKRLLQAELDRLQECKNDMKGPVNELPASIEEYLLK